jgi:sugar phosphate isomerase/epimerase
MNPCWLTDTVTSDLDRALHYTLLWGIDGVELRTVGGRADRVPYVNEEKLRRRLAEHAIPVAAVVPGLFTGAAKDRAVWLNEVTAFKETLDFCRRIGCARVVVSAFSEAGPDAADRAAEALRRAGAAASRQGLTLAVLNEVGMAYPTGAVLADLLAAVDHPSVHAAWDPAAAVQAGEAPRAGLQALTGRIGLVRCYNVVRQNGRWEAAPLEDGVVDWPDQLRLLYASGFDGPISLEIHLQPAAKHGLRMATALIQMIRATQRGL